MQRTLTQFLIPIYISPSLIITTIEYRWNIVKQYLLNLHHRYHFHDQPIGSIVENSPTLQSIIDLHPRRVREVDLDEEGVDWSHIVKLNTNHLFPSNFTSFQNPPTVFFWKLSFLELIVASAAALICGSVPINNNNL